MQTFAEGCPRNVCVCVFKHKDLFAMEEVKWESVKAEKASFANSPKAHKGFIMFLLHFGNLKLFELKFSRHTSNLDLIR